MSRYDDLLREADGHGYQANMAADYGNIEAAEEYGKREMECRREAWQHHTPSPQPEQWQQTATPSAPATPTPQPRETEKTRDVYRIKKKKKKKKKKDPYHAIKEGATSGAVGGFTQWVIDTLTRGS